MKLRWSSRRLGLPALLVGGFALFAGHGLALAQTDAAGSKPELSAEERAQRQADKVFTFIKLQSGKPAAKRPAEVPSPAAAPAAANNNQALAKAPPKPQAKVPVLDARPAPAPGLAAAVPAESQASSDLNPQGVLLAAASPTAASVQAEILPQPPAPAVRPKPPALQLLSKVEPEIPRQLQADFKGGAVTVRFVVQADGSVSEAQALQASHKRLGLAAVSAVNQWRFAPLPAPREASVEIAFAVE